MKFKKYLFLSAILILCACANNSILSLNTSFSEEISNDLSNYPSDNSSNLINNSLSSIDNTSSSTIVVQLIIQQVYQIQVVLFLIKMKIYIIQMEVNCYHYQQLN